jgi:hypothetical protein
VIKKLKELNLSGEKQSAENNQENKPSFWQQPGTYLIGGGLIFIGLVLAWLLLKPNKKSKRN